MDKKSIKPIKKEIVNLLNVPFKELSSVLQESTMDYALFRGCIEAESEDVFILTLLATTESANWRNIELVMDLNESEIYYEKKIKPFDNTKKILYKFSDVVETFNKIPVSFTKVYFDLNHTASFSDGYYGNPLLENFPTDVDDTFILLDNLQCYVSNYCFSDANSVIRDKVLTSGWKQAPEDIRWAAPEVEEEY